MLSFLRPRLRRGGVTVRHIDRGDNFYYIVVSSIQPWSPLPRMRRKEQLWQRQHVGSTSFGLNSTR